MIESKINNKISEFINTNHKLRVYVYILPLY